MLDDSSGKSGAKFYQSYDKLFIIKTLTSEEVERMHSFLKHYHPVSKIENECHQCSKLHGYLRCSISSSDMEKHCYRNIWECTG